MLLIKVTYNLLVGLLGVQENLDQGEISLIGLIHIHF